ncbi:hypothetical protein CSA37_06720 [Candidatus Fermentibacteria bacterium]|nr:MAG: hypothetical protein CSA37_06720 [Candidatus Fermentibacteria bacterium]
MFLPVSAETFTGALPQTEGTWELSLPVSAETFTGLDRELAGLLDSWAGLDRGRVYRLNAGISLLRAEAALSYAVLHSTDNLPEETAARWASYLKSCADCIITCRLCFGNVSSRLSKELLSASFERWQSCSEAFLMSVQSMR